MTLPRTVADVLQDHVTLEVESIDRMYLNIWQPRLQFGAGAAGFFTGHRGHIYASTGLMDPMTKAFVADIHHFIADRGVDLVHFSGERKDDVTQRYLAGFTAEEGVLYVGRSQEKSRVWRTRRRYHADGSSFAWLVKASALVNQFYFYCVDADFGPFFLKFGTYFPYTGRLCINGHEWAKRQAARAGIGFTALDNGFAACDDPAALQEICDSLGPEHIEALLRKWLRILPHPFTEEDIAAGYTYELSILQSEYSLTQVLDKPGSGRIFFEQVIADNLDIGRPDQVSLIFDRKIVRKGRYATPGRFRTQLISTDVVPSLHIDYKHNAVKQYHKLGRALRTETTINDSKADFNIPKRLTSLPQLRQIGFSANRRLLRVQTISRNPIPGEQAFAALTRPVITPAGTRIPGLPFGDARVHALLQALLIHRLLPRGFTSRELRDLIAPLLDTTPEDIPAGKMTYDLRRLREHGIITRIPRTRRYQVTDTGLQHALLFTHAHAHLLRAGLADITDPAPPMPAPLRAASRAYQAAFNDLAWHARLAA
jgi:hypothetical protein